MARKHASGWVCSDPDCGKLNRFGYKTSSLVRSNFKFKNDKPICNRCWNLFGYWYNDGIKNIDYDIAYWRQNENQNSSSTPTTR